jgi:putative inorganic carbon (HCO3(-)) transporter
LYYLAAGKLTLLLLIVVAIIAIFRWEYGLALTLASLSLVNRLKTVYFVDFGYAVVTAETVFILLLLFAWLIRAATRPRLEGFKSYLVGQVFWLFLSGVLSLFNSLDIRVSLRLLIAGVIEPIVLFYLIINNLRGIRQVKLVVYALIASASFATVYGLWQIFLTISETGNPFDYRIVSAFYSPAIFGEILLLSFPLAVVTRISLQEPNRTMGLFLDFVLGCMIVAMLLTITRSVWLGLLVSLAVLLLNREMRSYFYRRVSIVSIVLIFLVIQSGAVSELSGLLELFQRRPVSLNDFGDPTSSIGERIFAWQTALVMIMDNPIGIGLGMFRQIWPTYQPVSAGLDAAHNLFLDIGVEMGVLGAIAFIWIVTDSVRIGIRLVRTSADPYVARLGLGILSGLAGYFVHALSGGAELVHNVLNVIDPLGSPISTGMLVFWSLLGCLFILRQSEKTRDRPALLRNGPTERNVKHE